LTNCPPFFGAAWQACRRIPPGETRSYAWLAAAAGRPRAVRAAGQAMARNPWALIIPCHRVIGSDGGLHGYGAGGLKVKARLLEMERAGLDSGV
jgi:O-6-methylguanine DNA methyltransferase